MALNRRVQVTFTHHAFADTDELRRSLMDGSVQRFTIDPTKDQVITGAEGIEVVLPAGALVDALGRPVPGAVQVELTERERKWPFIFLWPKVFQFFRNRSTWETRK